jgi:molybdopterin synthase sulfur carrier subunit
MTSVLLQSEATETTGLVEVRYWAAARAAAGVAAETVRASTVADTVLAVLSRRVGDSRFADTIGCCSILVDGCRADRLHWDTFRLNTGDVVEFLPPFAGG